MTEPLRVEPFFGLRSQLFAVEYTCCNGSGVHPLFVVLAKVLLQNGIGNMLAMCCSCGHVARPLPNTPNGTGVGLPIRPGVVDWGSMYI